jgi:hypothetical protein
VQDELDDTELEYTKGSQDPFSNQDPFDEAIKLLVGVSDSEIERNESVIGTKRIVMSYMPPRVVQMTHFILLT